MEDDNAEKREECMPCPPLSLQRPAVLGRAFEDMGCAWGPRENQLDRLSERFDRSEG